MTFLIYNILNDVFYMSPNQIERCSDYGKNTGIRIMKNVKKKEKTISEKL